ncbi:MAG: RNA-binding transcriptional accessory protein [Firmicutes bacterium]|nr:RNA-binding transcriptional accessory protein [Bacillota bacterium]
MDQNLINKQLMEELSLEQWQVENVIALLDEGNTIPFIARYRKEAHGTLSDEVLRAFSERLTYLRALAEKKDQVIRTIEEQGKLTEELKAQIENAKTQVEVDDLYRPFRPKRRTRGSIAKERGLEPLAKALLDPNQPDEPEALAAPYVDPEKEIPDIAAALSGASDIIAEDISDQAEYRARIRKLTFDQGTLTSKAKDADAESVYEMYYDFQELVNKLPGHQVLALNRGEKEKFLKVDILSPIEQIEAYLLKKIVPAGIKSPGRIAVLENAAKDAYKRLIAPSIETEIRNELTEKAQDGAIKVFGQNLIQLLMQPPISGQTVLGFDPGYRNGCKLAVVDSTGKVLDTGVIYPTMGKGQQAEAKVTFVKMMAKNRVSLISLGNGTASRESEQFIADVLSEYNPLAKAKNAPTVSYVVVSESGASIYSASKLAAEEFPDYDVNLRSAVSIARRLQDPLAELVKITPESIGVGQYQHDMDQKKLSEALGGVVETCVNRVGVDLNTASPSLLSYISGISKPIAKNIVAYREENGPFPSRKALLKVPKLGPKAFEQCAGFLRVPGGQEPLDNTAVHPESYEAARGMLTKMGYSLDELIEKGSLRSGMPLVQIQLKGMDRDALAEELGVGVPTLTDIAQELAKPGRDPRSEMPKPVLRTDVLSMEDLKVGMVLKGTVRNVIDFGAFVDIGVHQDGLVHISQLSNKFVKHPLDVVKVGDVVDVKVVSLDIAKKRIGLSMKNL